MSEEATITIKKDDLWKYSTFALIAIITVFLYFNFGDSKTSGDVVNTGSGVDTQGQGSKVTASADDDARIGSKDAEVEIIEFSDFQCPFCKSVSLTIKQVLQEYGD